MCDRLRVGGGVGDETQMSVDVRKEKNVRENITTLRLSVSVYVNIYNGN